jgi:hypothetical protein
MRETYAVLNDRNCFAAPWELTENAVQPQGDYPTNTPPQRSRTSDRRSPLFGGATRRAPRCGATCAPRQARARDLRRPASRNITSRNVACFRGWAPEVRCGAPIELVEVAVDVGPRARSARRRSSSRASYGAAAVLGPRHELAVHAAGAELQVTGTRIRRPHARCDHVTPPDSRDLSYTFCASGTVRRGGPVAGNTLLQETRIVNKSTIDNRINTP